MSKSVFISYSRKDAIDVEFRSIDTFEILKFLLMMKRLGSLNPGNKISGIKLMTPMVLFYFLRKML